MRRAECVERHYGEFVADKNAANGLELRVNGSNTLGENISDIGGLLQSYYAYCKYQLKNWISR